MNQYILRARFQSRVRFGANADAAKEALEKAKEENEGKIIINEVELQCRVLEGICQNFLCGTLKMKNYPWNVFTPVYFAL